MSQPSRWMQPSCLRLDYEPVPGLSRSTPLQIIFTSGTTSEPKGIVHTHGNVLASLDPIEREIARYRRYARPFHPLRFLHTLPLSHVFGQFMGLWVPPLLAAEVHFESRLDAPRLIQIIHAQRISVLAAVPRVLELLRSHLTRLDPTLATRLKPRRMSPRSVRWWRFRRQHRLFGWKFWAFVCGGATLAAGSGAVLDPPRLRAHPGLRHDRNHRTGHAESSLPHRARQHRQATRRP